MKVKLLKETIEKNHYLGLGEDILDMTLKPQSIKRKKW